MAKRSRLDFLADIFIDDDDDSDFLGFTEDNLAAIEVESDESDVEVEEAVMADSDESDSDGSGDSSDDEATPIDHRNAEWRSDILEDGVDHFLAFDEFSGTVNELDAASNPFDFFQLIFDDDTFDMIADETNRYASQCQREKPDSKWQEVSAKEIKLFIAINILMGIVKLDAFEDYWSTDQRLHQSSIASLMSRNRYERINRYLHLNNTEQAVPRGQPGHDKLHKVRPLLEHVRQKFAALYKPGCSVSIDEAMIKYNGRLLFKQYMKGKPTPWGIKVWCCAEPKTGYLLDFQVYTGKSEQPLEGEFIIFFNVYKFI